MQLEWPVVGAYRYVLSGYYGLVPSGSLLNNSSCRWQTTIPTWNVTKLPAAETPRSSLFTRLPLFRHILRYSMSFTRCKMSQATDVRASQRQGAGRQMSPYAPRYHLNDLNCSHRIHPPISVTELIACADEIARSLSLHQDYAPSCTMTAITCKPSSSWPSSSSGSTVLTLPTGVLAVFGKARGPLFLTSDNFRRAQPRAKVLES